MATIFVFLLAALKGVADGRVIRQEGRSLKDDHCFRKNWDYEGNDIKSIFVEASIWVKSAAECQQLCQQENLCFYWTWVSKGKGADAAGQLGNFCYLKNNQATEKGRTLTGFISGPKDCGTDFVKVDDGSDSCEPNHREISSRRECKDANQILASGLKTEWKSERHELDGKCFVPDTDIMLCRFKQCSVDSNCDEGYHCDDGLCKVCADSPQVKCIGNSHKCSWKFVFQTCPWTCGKCNNPCLRPTDKYYDEEKKFHADECIWTNNPKCNQKLKEATIKAKTYLSGEEIMVDGVMQLKGYPPPHCTPDDRRLLTPGIENGAQLI